MTSDGHESIVAVGELKIGKRRRNEERLELLLQILVMLRWKEERGLYSFNTFLPDSCLHQRTERDLFWREAGARSTSLLT